MKKSVLIEIIANNQCNKRCEYCDLDFRTKTFNRKELDQIIDFFHTNSQEVEYFHVNFFGGEPLLSFDVIEYLLSNIKIPNIKYSIGTNGVLFSEKILKILRDHKFEIYLSLDNIDGIEALKKMSLSGYEDLIQVNCINDPDFLYRSKDTIDAIVTFGFTRINFMPVLTTKTWTKPQMVELGKLKNYTMGIMNIGWNYFSYYNGFSKDLQFILDTNMMFYKDLDSLIWLQKQYSVLPENFRKELEEKSRIGKLGGEVKNISTLIAKHDVREIGELILSIPRVLGKQKVMLVLDKILKNAGIT